MQTNLEILSFFTASSQDAYQSRFNSVIEKSYRIALKYLHFNRLRILRILDKEDLTVQELAIDCIASLFVKGNDSELISIRQTFYNWQPPITTEEDCIYFLNKVVASRVEQHLYKLFKEEDPFFSKLLDSINYLIRKNGYHKNHFLGKTFIVEDSTDEFEKSFITSDKFESLPTSLFENKKTLLADLMNHLKTETNFNAAIPFNDLIYRLKHINFSDFLITESTSSTINKMEVSQIVDVGFSFASEKLLTTYFEKGKLNADEKNAFQSALKEMSSDLCDGGLNPGLYAYLAPHILGLNEVEYKSKYHNILEYLLRVMKSKIAEELTKLE